ncbi:MAG: type II secretion system F family protein [Magnetococcales bacterium]|nr:type II secretion system F family protein [Magnetococcales bacterium]
MGYFNYKIIDTDGMPRGGLVELPFDSPMSAIAFLERQGGTVLYANPLPNWLGSLVGMVGRFFEAKISREELAEALTNLSVMLRAGVPLLSGLRDTMASHDNPSLAKVGKEMVMRIENGSSFTDAAKSYPRIFPDIMLFLTRLGEESGSLDRTIKDAAEHIRRIDRIIKDTKQALIYPSFMFVAILGALGFWIYIVVPTMKGLFKSMQLDLPPLTVWVIDGSMFVMENFISIVTGIVVFSMLFKQAVRRIQPLRLKVHGVYLKLPVVKLIINAYNLAFITEYFRMLVNAGVDIVRSLEILGEALGNEVYRTRMARVRSSLFQGLTLRESFEQAKLFPSFVVRMIGVGEQSGTLSDQLGYLAEEYRMRLDRLVANIGKTVEPLALMVGGGLFALMAGSLFAPLYQLISKI